MVAASTPGRQASPVFLEFDEIEEGTTDLALEVAAAELELEDDQLVFSQPLKVGLRIDRCLEMYTVSGRVHYCVEGTCARCLTAATEAVEVPLRFLFQRRQASQEELDAVEDEDIEIFDPGASGVDLKEYLREELILELPLRLYCQPDCKGLCAQCGADLNSDVCSCGQQESDPRWAALKDIKFS